MKFKSTLLLVYTLLLSANILAQLFEIGHTSNVFFDNDRNRNVEVEIYYPSLNSGENVPVASGSFPVIVFGHGYRMSWESYQNFWIELVPLGYVMCFPTTEKGVIPNHRDFGLDIKFVGIQMQAQNMNSASIFFNSLSSKTALMGHSMGGGASFLAAENNSSISTLVNFAAAETNTSAISAAKNVIVPSLIFSGDDDCVTPPNLHQDLMYDNLASTCKIQLSLKEGGHCYFADYNFSCSLGESSCNPDLKITIEEQQSISFDFLKLWLSYTLDDNQNAYATFYDSLQNSTRINFYQACTLTGAAEISGKDEVVLFPNPVIDVLHVNTNLDEEIELELYSITGKFLWNYTLNENDQKVDLQFLNSGIYMLRIESTEQILVKRIIKVAP